jgi:hypothetical protein
LGWQATQAVDNDGGRHRELAGLVTAHVANYQFISKVEPSLNSTNPTLYFPLANSSEHF